MYAPPMHHGRIFDKNDNLEECMSMGVDYVQVIVDSFNERFRNFFVFHSSKLFSPKCYQIEENIHINMCD
jgi:hypothetical protein